jgi:hypothetical protein
MSFLVIGFFAAIRRVEAGLGPGVPGRVGLALGLGLAAFGAMFLTFPSFFRGPTVDADPTLVSIWLTYVEEYQAFPLVASMADIGNLILFLGAATATIPLSLWLATRDRQSRLHPGWTLIGLSVSALIPLAVLHVRFVPYPELLAIPPLMARLSGLHHRIAARSLGLAGRLSGALASATVIAGPLLLGAILTDAGRFSPRVARDATEVASHQCSISQVAPILNADRGLGSRGRTILAHLDLGPEILYRTAHRVLGTPYHRNTDGILTGRLILGTPVDDETRELISERGIDLILHCPDAPGLPPAPGDRAAAPDGAPPRCAPLPPPGNRECPSLADTRTTPRGN